MKKIIIIFIISVLTLFSCKKKNESIISLEKNICELITDTLQCDGVPFYNEFQSFFVKKITQSKYVNNSEIDIHKVCYNYLQAFKNQGYAHVHFMDNNERLYWKEKFECSGINTSKSGSILLHKISKDSIFEYKEIFLKNKLDKTYLYKIGTKEPNSFELRNME